MDSALLLQRVAFSRKVIFSLQERNADLRRRRSEVIVSRFPLRILLSLFSPHFNSFRIDLFILFSF